MKVILLNSPIYRESKNDDEDYLPPLGLGYIATHIKKFNINVKIVDCVRERYGITEVLKLLNEEKPDWIGINIFTQNYNIVKEIVESSDESVNIIVGGQVVKHISNDIMEWNIKNKLVLVVGEGEIIIPHILKNTCEEKPVKTLKNKYIYEVNKNSKYFPIKLENSFLNRALFKDYKIVNHYGQNEAALITSRGCPYNCAFCGGAYCMNKDSIIRYREYRDIRQEIINLCNQNKELSSIRIVDDLFLRDENSIKNAISLFNEFPLLTWRGMAHILSFKNSFYLLDDLKKSGCTEIFIGIESGSEKIRKKINKLGCIKDIITTIEKILCVGIDVKAYFIYGFPSETEEDAILTFNLAKDIMKVSKITKGNFRTSVFQFRPYHGTQLYKEIIASGKVINEIKDKKYKGILPRRNQFNFESGNYSQMDENILEKFIVKTQQLTENK